MSPRSLRALILGAALVLGVFLRVRGLGGDFLFGDEHHSLFAKDASYAEILADFDDRGSHAALPAMQRASAQLFGGGAFVYRLPALLGGFASLLFALVVARRLVGANAAALTTLALALSPFHVFYSRFSRGYAAASALTLALFACLLVTRETGSKRAGLGAVAAGALAPWVHLTNAASVAAAFACALLTDRERRVGHLVRGAAAALVGAALFWPAREAVHAYLTRIRSAEEVGPSGFLDVPSVLFGGPMLGAVGLVALVIALVVVGRGNREKFLWLAAGIAAPVAFLLASRPQGVVFAWARYLFPALPFLFMVVAGAWMRVVRAERAALAIGAAGLLAAAAVGPLGFERVDDGPFSGTYLAMCALPAFDEPWDDASPYWRELAADESVESIVEAPHLRNRAVLLYRNHAFVHGKRVRLGWAREAPGLPDARTLSPELYAVLEDPDFPGNVDADRLVLHKNPGAEATRYWEFVYERAWPDLERFGDRGPMLDLSRIPGRAGAAPELHAALASRLGAPIYEDGDLVVWSLR